ncbi:MAG: tetratricopeptide repeat protein [Magnetococcales bacterium]|nr:tetratricopeptide repeat protein [Magnetococcales bacterium]
MTFFYQLCRGLLLLCLFIALPINGFAVSADNSNLVIAQERLIKVEKKFGPTHLNSAMALQAMAEHFIREKKFLQAIQMLERASAIRKVANGPNHPLVFNLYTTIAKLHINSGKLDEAVLLLESVVKSAQKRLGSKHIKTAQAKIEVANLYRFDRNKLEEAEKLVTEALPVLEAGLWSEHHQVADALNIMASAQLNLGKVQLAKTNWLRALQIRTANYGSDNTKVAEIMRNLGVAHVWLGEVEQGSELLKGSVEIFQNNGSDDLQMVKSLEPLAELMVRNKQYGEVLPVMEQILAIREKLLGDNSPGLIKYINDIALVYMQTGVWQKAKDQFNRALLIAEKKFGKNHVQSAFIIGNLSEINRLGGDNVLAKKQLEQGVDIAKNFFKDDSLGLSSWLSSIGVTLHKSGNYEQASKLFQQSLAILETEYGANHPNVEKVRSTLKGLMAPSPAKDKVEPPVTAMDRVVSATPKDIAPPPIQINSSILMAIPGDESALSLDIVDTIVADSIKSMLTVDPVNLSTFKETPDINSSKPRSIVSIDCFLPDDLKFKQLFDEFKQLDLPFYKQSKIIEDKLYSCLILGPFLISKFEVENIVKNISKKFGFENLSVTDYK